MEIKFRKFLNGGNFAPFLSTYQPLLINSLTPDPTLAYLANLNALSQQEVMGLLNGSTKASTKSTTLDKSLDLTYKLLNDLRGLDSDVQQVAAILEKLNASSAILGTSALDYYRTLSMVNKVIDSKEEYKETFNIAKNNRTLSEAAITADGQVVLLTSQGYTMATPDKAIKAVLSGKARICKNSDLLNDRRHNPNMAFNNELLTIVLNGVSLDTIKNNISIIASNIGNKEFKYSGYTRMQLGRIQSGLLALGEIAQLSAAGHTVDGTYKDTYLTKTNKENIAYAIEAIYSSLSSPEIAYLQLHSDGTAKGAKAMLLLILTVRVSESTTFDANLLKDLDSNGNKIDKKTGKSKTDKDPEKPLSAPELFVTGMTYSDRVMIAPGTAYAFEGIGRYGTLASDKLGSGSTLENVSSSGWAPVFDLENASIGGLIVKNLDLVVLNNADVIGVDLPYTTTKEGHIIPDYSRLKDAEDLNKALIELDLTDSPNNAEKINEICQYLEMPDKYVKNAGLWVLNTKNYRRFAMLGAVASERAFGTDATKHFQESTVTEVDDNTREWFLNVLKKLKDDKKYKFNDPFWGHEKLYQSLIFVPVREDALFASLALGSSYSYTGNIKDASTARALIDANLLFLDKKDYYVDPGSLDDYEQDDEE